MDGPSFYVEEHFATFNLRPKETVQIVFHTGAKVGAKPVAVTIADPAGLLTWAAKDRCVATLADMKDVKAKKGALVAIVKQWIRQM